MSTTRDTASEAASSRAALLGAADSAAARGDHDQALQLWSEARGQFPDAVPAWLRAAEVMIRLLRLAEADILLADAVRRFPKDFWVARTRAFLFRHLGDEAEAYTEARALRRTFPDNPAAHSDLVELLLNQKRVAIAEAEAKASLSRFPDARWLHHMYARCADQTGDNRVAASRWIGVLVRHPDHVQAYAPLVRALIAEGRLDEAAGIARAGLQLLPNSAAVREAGAAVEEALPAALAPSAEHAPAMDLLAAVLRAESSGAWAEAARLWDALRPQVPAFARAYAGGARALLRLGRMAEAEIVLAKARRDLPADAGVLEAWADAAAERGDLLSALVRFRALRQAFPGAPGVDMAIARTLHALGRLDEADAAFAELVERYPEEIAVAKLFASIASERGDGMEAIRRWTRITAAFPEHADGYWHLADAMVGAERFADADAVLCHAAARFHDDLETVLRWAMSGRATGDATRFDELCRQFPKLAPLVG